MRTLACVVVALCAAPTTAQSYFTIPHGYETQLGHTFFGQVHLFHATNNRAQVVTPFVMKTKGLLKGLAYRTSQGLWYTTNTGWGRKWSSVYLALGHTDATKMTSTFAKNYNTSGATAVFSGAWSVPNQTHGAYSKKPVWGDAGNLPFTKSFAYDGKSDLLRDWTMSMPVFLDGRTYAHVGGIRYNLDACDHNPIVQSSPGRYGSKYVPRSPFKTPYCGPMLNQPAMAHAQLVLWGNTSNTPQGWYLAILTSATQPSSNVVSALTIGGSDTGIPASALCNGLNVNLASPLILSAGFTDKQGIYTPLDSKNSVGSHPDKLAAKAAGLVLYWQAAWEDKSTKQLGLTLATKLVIPPKPRACAGMIAVSRFLYQGKTWLPSATNASYGYLSLYKQAPIVRFTKN